MSDFDKPITVAVFRCQEYGFTSVLNRPSTADDEWCLDGYSRLSEWQEIQFKPLSPDGIAGAELIALTKLREKVVAQFSEKLESIDGRMANLRALAAPEQR